MIRIKINHVAVWVVAIVHQLVGFAWYSFVFADEWIKAAGLQADDFKDQSPLPYIISLAGAVVLCYAVAWLFTRLQVQTASRGLLFALVFWFSFLFFELLTFNSFELKPYELAFINAGKSLVTFALTGLVLGAWTKKKAPAYKAPVYAHA